jgi:hypothetical protein
MNEWLVTNNYTYLLVSVLKNNCNTYNTNIHFIRIKAPKSARKQREVSKQVKTGNRRQGGGVNLHHWHA